jgi:hypothetical protein
MCISSPMRFKPEDHLVERRTEVGQVDAHRHDEEALHHALLDVFDVDAAAGRYVETRATTPFWSRPTTETIARFFSVRMREPPRATQRHANSTRWVDARQRGCDGGRGTRGASARSSTIFRLE